MLLHPGPALAQAEEEPVVVEYVSTHDEMAADPAFAEFASVFERFQSAEAMFNPDTDTDASAKAKPAADDATVVPARLSIQLIGST